MSWVLILVDFDPMGNILSCWGSIWSGFFFSTLTLPENGNFLKLSSRFNKWNWRRTSYLSIQKSYITSSSYQKNQMAKSWWELRHFFYHSCPRPLVKSILFHFTTTIWFRAYARSCQLRADLKFNAKTVFQMPRKFICHKLHVK